MYWIEIRCDGDAETCWSHQNKGPMDGCTSTRTQLVATVQTLQATARKAGWKRIQRGWLCPVCAAARGK